MNAAFRAQAKSPRVTRKPSEFVCRVTNSPNAVGALETANDENPPSRIEDRVFMVAPTRHRMARAGDGHATGRAKDRVVFVSNRVGFRLF